MGVKKNPSSLYSIALQEVAKLLLQQWRNSYGTNYNHYSNELKSNIGVVIPFTVYDQIFDLMVDSHARVIQNETNDSYPSITGLINSIIVPSLRKLNLNCLRHMGTVTDEELRYLECVLTSELPCLSNLVEISLQTSGTDFTLPICNDDILVKIGSSCSKLRTLDISYNHNVTDKGLESLLPSCSQSGCPQLVKISLFECSVTAEGVAMLLESLPRLKFLGYRETGQSLMFLNQKFLSSSNTKFELAHLNNLGTICRTCKDLHKLKCDDKMVNVICRYCPKLSGLKVRVNDSEVKFLQQIYSVNILELVYNLGTPSSPGSNTVQYLQLCGTKLVSLSFVCDTFTTYYLKVVSEHCNNLKRLWIRSNKFNCDVDLTTSDKRKCCLSNLEVLFFRVGCPGFETCRIPQNVMNYVLHKTDKLTEVVFSMKNALVCDSYMHELFSSIQTSKLKHIMLLVPHKNLPVSSLNLSMATVETLIGMCPQLEQLGNLLVWDVCLEEIQDLRRQLKLTNSALILWYKQMYS